MFRMWCKIFTAIHLINDTVIIYDNPDISRTKIVRDGVNEACRLFDLSYPIWLDKTINEFKRHDKARFYQDNFVEGIDFDFLEIHVIEED